MNHAQDVPFAPAAPSYGFHCVLPDLSFTQAVALVTEALKTEGLWGSHRYRIRSPCCS
jgi:hypothetical protein